MLILALQKKVSKILCAVCIVFFILCTLYVNAPKAHAQLFGGGVVTVVGGAGSLAEIETALSSSLNHILNQALNEKEFIFDPLVFELAQRALEQQLSDLLNWFNGGFQLPDGSYDAAFITNLEEYRQDARDQFMGEFVYEELDDSKICEPFKHDVINAVAKQYQEKEKKDPVDQLKCSLKGNPAKNKAFLEGDFNSGGWEAILSIMRNPEETTAVGVRLNIEKIASEEAANKEINALIEANWGDGVRSKKVCNNTPTPGISDDCTIVMPGALILDQMAFQMQVPTLSLIQADELSEVISSLFGGLVNQAFTGINGLLGLGGNAEFSVNAFGESGGLSYLDALLEIQTSGSNVGIGTMKETYEKTEEYFNYQITILTLITDISNQYIEAEKDHEGLSCWNLKFPNSLSNMLDDLTSEIQVTLATIFNLELLIDGYESASTKTEQNAYLNDYMELIALGSVVTESDILTIESELKNTIRPAVVDLEAKIKKEEQSCN